MPVQLRISLVGEMSRTPTNWFIDAAAMSCTDTHCAAVVFDSLDRVAEGLVITSLSTGGDAISLNRQFLKPRR